MEFIDQILTTVKNSPNPEMYYLGLAIGLIFVFYVVNKILKIVTFFLIAGVLFFGFTAMQGKDISTVLASVTTFVNKTIADGSFKQSFSDLVTSLSK